MKKKKSRTNGIKEFFTPPDKKTGTPQIAKVISPVHGKIPYKGITEDGIMLLPDGKWSRSYHVPGINFLTYTRQSQTTVVMEYMRIFTSMKENVDCQVFLYNRSVTEREFQKRACMPLKDDGKDSLRMERNEERIRKMAEANNNLERIAVLTFSLPAKDADEARTRFKMEIEPVLGEKFSKISGGKCSELKALERLDLLREIYRPFDPGVSLQETNRDIKDPLEKFDRIGCSTKELVAPVSFLQKRRELDLGSCVSRSYVCYDWPVNIYGDILTNFLKLPFNVIVSVYFNTINPQNAKRFLKTQRRTVSGDVIDKQIKSEGRYDASIVNPDSDEALTEIKEMFKTIHSDDARLIRASLVITVFARDEKQIGRYQDMLFERAANQAMGLQVMDTLHADGLATSLPLGYKLFAKERVFTSYDIGPMVPFMMKDTGSKGIYMGQDPNTGSLIFYNPDHMKNLNGIVTGRSGYGKSLAVKLFINDINLTYDDYVFCVDPRFGEYTELFKRLGGQVIKISSNSENHLNPWELSLANKSSKIDPVKNKCDFIETYINLMLFDEKTRFGISEEEKTIISHCAMEMYKEYADLLREMDVTYSPETAPTINDFYERLMNYKGQKPAVAKDLAFKMQRFVSGHTTTFSYRTNVDIHNRFVAYDLSDVEDNIRDIAYHVCLENIKNQISMLWGKGHRIWVVIDEMHMLLVNDDVARVLIEMWKTVRHFNCGMWGITQDMKDIENTSTSTILDNSDFLMMKGQSRTVIPALTDRYNLSEEEVQIIREDKVGSALLVLGQNNKYTINNEIEMGTEIYRLVQTDRGNVEV